MAEEQPITTNPFPVPIEETAPKWWLEDPEPMYRITWLDIIVAIVIVYVAGGLVLSIYNEPHICCGGHETYGEETWSTTDAADYPHEPFPSNDCEVKDDLAADNS